MIRSAALLFGAAFFAPATLLGATRVTDEGAGSDKVVMEAIETLASDAIHARCHGLMDATIIHYVIAISNPISGRDMSQGEVLAWVNQSPLRNAIYTQISVTPNDALSTQYKERYMKAFGPISIPTSLPATPLYLRDKAYCEAFYEVVE